MARRAVCLVALAATTNAFFTGTPLRARVAPLNMAGKKQGSSKTKADPISDECSADDVSAPSADCMDSYPGAPPAQAARERVTGRVAGPSRMSYTAVPREPQMLPAAPASVSQKVDTLLTELGFSETDEALPKKIDMAVKELGMKKEVKSMKMVEKVDACLATLGMTVAGDEAALVAPQSMAPGEGGRLPRDARDDGGRRRS